jgi:hypothetical protein
MQSQANYTRISLVFWQLDWQLATLEFETASQNAHYEFNLFKL